MKYLLITDVDSDFPSVGVITHIPGRYYETEARFKQAVEEHFDAKILGYEVVDRENLHDCLHDSPIDVMVDLEGFDGGVVKQNLTVSQTWLY